MDPANGIIPHHPPGDDPEREVCYLEQFNGAIHETNRALEYSEPLMLALSLLPKFQEMVKRDYTIFGGIERWIDADEVRAPRLLEHLIAHQELDLARQLIMIGKWSGKYHMIARSPPGHVYRSLEDLAVVEQLLESSPGARYQLDYAGMSIALIQHFARSGFFSVGQWARILMVAVVHHPDPTRVTQIQAVIRDRLPGEQAERAISSEICAALLSESRLDLDIRLFAPIITLSPDELFALCFTQDDRFKEQDPANDYHYRTQLLQMAIAGMTELTWSNCQVLIARCPKSEMIVYPKLFSCIPKHLIQWADIYPVENIWTRSSYACASPNPLFMDSWFAFRVSGMYYYLSPRVTIYPSPEGDRLTSSRWTVEQTNYASQPEWISCGHLFQEQRYVLMPQLLVDFIVASSQSIAKNARSGAEI